MIGNWCNPKSKYGDYESGRLKITDILDRYKQAVEDLRELAIEIHSISGWWPPHVWPKDVWGDTALRQVEDVAARHAVKAAPARKQPELYAQIHREFGVDSAGQDG